MAIRGLGTEMGVAMPRYVGSWLASLGPVSTIMAATFAPIAIFGLIEVLGKLPGAIHNGELALEGFGEAQRKVFEEGIREAYANTDAMLAYLQRLREIALIGKDGAARAGLEAIFNAVDMKEKTDELQGYVDRQKELSDLINRKPAPSESVGTSSAGTPIYAPDPNQPSAAAIAKAKTEMESLKPEIAKVNQDIQNLHVQELTITAQAKADAAKDGADAEKHAEERQKRTDHLLAEAAERWKQGLLARWAQADEEAEHERELTDAIKAHSAADTQAIVAGGLAAMAQIDAWREADRQLKAEQKAAADEELARLGVERERIARTYETSEQRIEGQYLADVAKYSAAEEKKRLAGETDETRRWQITQSFAALRASLYTREQTELQMLRNSQGWQGVFGSEFAEGLKRNEALARAWAESTNQSAMLVRVSLENLKETAQAAFGELAKGEAGSIMSAVVYGKSIKAAMEEATKAVLTSVSEQAGVKAIESLAWAALDFAVGDFPGSAEALVAAALFGSLAAATAVAGRAIPNAQGGSGGAGGGGGADRSGSGSGGSSGSRGPMQGTAADMGGSHTTVNVYGHVYGPGGVGQLISDVNDAVLNSGHTLTATNTTSGIQIIK
jgi:hypothetical protein